jgi:hypothetical protein
VFASDSIRYLDPSGEDLTNGSYMLPSVSLQFPAAVTGLPVREDYPRLEDACEQAVTLAVAALNRAVNPVLEALESS